MAVGLRAVATGRQAPQAVLRTLTVLLQLGWANLGAARLALRAFAERMNVRSPGRRALTTALHGRTAILQGRGAVLQAARALLQRCAWLGDL